MYLYTLTLSPISVRSIARNPLPLSNNKLLRQLSGGPENRCWICVAEKQQIKQRSVKLIRRCPFSIDASHYSRDAIKIKEYLNGFTRFYNEHEGGGLDRVQLVLLDLKTQIDAFSPVDRLH